MGNVDSQKISAEYTNVTTLKPQKWIHVHN